MYNTPTILAYRCVVTSSKRVRQSLFGLHHRRNNDVANPQDSAAHVSLSSIQLSNNGYRGNRYHRLHLRTPKGEWLEQPSKQHLRAISLDLPRANDVVASGAPPSLWRVYRPHSAGVSTHKNSIFELFLTNFQCGIRHGPARLNNGGNSAGGHLIATVLRLCLRAASDPIPQP